MYTIICGLCWFIPKPVLIKGIKHILNMLANAKKKNQKKNKTEQKKNKQKHNVRCFFQDGSVIVAPQWPLRTKLFQITLAFTWIPNTVQ